MKKHRIVLGMSIGLMVASVAYIAKKTGFFEDDAWLYDEYDSTLNK